MLRIVRRIGNELRVGVRHKHIETLVETLLSLQLEGMIDRISMVLIESLKPAAELRKWQQCLGDCGRADTVVHVLHPPSVGERNTIDRGVTSV